MKALLALGLELAWMILVSPSGLTLRLQKLPGRLAGIVIFVLLSLVSLSFATALYHLRSHYTRAFVVLIPLMAVICFFFLVLSGFVFTAVLDQWIRWKKPDKAVHLISALQIVLLAWIPGIFVLPAAVTAAIFSFKMILFWVLFGFIAFWSFNSLAEAMRYHYEMDKKSIRLACLITTAILVGLAALFFLFGFFELATVVV
ncbi:MAG: hypothetical protein KDK39_07610 [Leptospiraceae bacterium]|nr:hypothetical protein [Leptospiraceae bacterium]